MRGNRKANTGTKLGRVRMGPAHAHVGEEEGQAHRAGAGLVIQTGALGLSRGYGSQPWRTHCFAVALPQAARLRARHVSL